jgi:hypothetical protein
MTDRDTARTRTPPGGLPFRGPTAGSGGLEAPTVAASSTTPPSPPAHAVPAPRSGASEAFPSAPAGRATGPGAPDGGAPLGSVGGPGGSRPWWARRPPQWIVVGLVAVVQIVIIISAVVGWSADAPAVASDAPPPPTVLDGVVHDTGPDGVNLRTAPQVSPSTTNGRVATDSQHLQILCGQRGDAVSGGGARSTTWLKTSDDLFVSALYVTVTGRTQIASCPQPDLPLVAPAAAPASASPGVGLQGATPHTEPPATSAAG